MKPGKLFMMLMFLLLATGCGSEPPKPKSSAPPPFVPPPPVGKTVEQENDRDVCPRAGIGDRKVRFNKEYADETKNVGKTSYGNGRYDVVFIEGRAFNITVAADADHRMDPNLVEMIPSDATLTEEEERQDNQTITRINRYTSKLLAEACPKSGGKFEVYEVHDKQSGQYRQTVIACQIEMPKGIEKTETETLTEQK